MHFVYPTRLEDISKTSESSRVFPVNPCYPFILTLNDSFTIPISGIILYVFCIWFISLSITVL